MTCRQTGCTRAAVRNSPWCDAHMREFVTRAFRPCDCIYSPNPGDCDHKSAVALNGAARVAPGALGATADPIPVGRPVHADAKPGPPNAGPVEAAVPPVASLPVLRSADHAEHRRGGNN